jgi:ATP-dependent helicase/nuclease subunit A
VEIGGLVDRLAVTGDCVTLADYKTDRAPPAQIEDIPVGYLRQMAAYQAILAQIFPAHRINCLLIWTETATAMAIPAALLLAQAPA